MPSLEELYLTYRKDLYRYLLSLTHNAALAEDLLSETFLEALQRLHAGMETAGWSFSHYRLTFMSANYETLANTGDVRAGDIPLTAIE